MTERFEKLLKKSGKKKSHNTHKKRSNALDFLHDFKIKYLNEIPCKKQNDEKVLPPIKIKSNANEIVYKYDKRKHLDIGKYYEIWARDYGYFTGRCVWKDIRRDAAEFFIGDGKFRTVILSKTTYLPVKE